jgi:uncharacterized protein
MIASVESTQKYLVNMQEGKEKLERATVSLILAVTSAKNHETSMFVTSDAADLLVKGATDGLVANGLEPIKDLLEQFVGLGGKIWLCKICAKVKGINEENIINGVEIVGAPTSIAFLDSGAKVLS